MGKCRVPDFFPENCKEWINECLYNSDHVAKIQINDIKILLDDELDKHWKVLKENSKSDYAFEMLFIRASVHKTHFDENKEPKEIIDCYDKIIKLSEKLSKTLTANNHIYHNLNDSTFSIIKNMNEYTSPLTPSGEIHKLFSSKNPYPFNKGLPKISDVLLELSSKATIEKDKVKFFKDEFLATKHRANTASRTTGIKYMADITTDEAHFAKPCWEAISFIILALHGRDDDFDGYKVRRIWEESQKHSPK